jgi:hypothetical protein
VVVSNGIDAVVSLEGIGDDSGALNGTMSDGAVTGILVEVGLVVAFVSLRSTAPAARNLVKSSLSDVAHDVTTGAAIKTNIRRNNTSACLHFFDCRPPTTGSVFDASSESDSVTI